MHSRKSFLWVFLKDCIHAGAQILFAVIYYSKLLAVIPDPEDHCCNSLGRSYYTVAIFIRLVLPEVPLIMPPVMTTLSPFCRSFTSTAVFWAK